MKRKLLLFVLVGLLGSGMYVGATTLLPDQVDPVFDSRNDLTETNWNNMYQPGNRGHMSLDYYLSEENHTAIMAKRIELTNSLFGNYEQMTNVEIIEADSDYHEALRTFMASQLGEESDLYYDRDYFRNHHGFDQETVVSMIRKRVEFTNVYLSDYSELAIEEQQQAEVAFHDAMHDYMYSLMIESDDRYGRGPCHGGRYYEYRDDRLNDFEGEETYYNRSNNTRHRGGMMGW